MSKEAKPSVATDREEAAAELMLAAHLRESMECLKGRKYALAITAFSHVVMTNALAVYMGRLRDELGIASEDAL